MADVDTVLDHEEVWDDSALIDSWNEALEEYKKYHSIYLKGGDISKLNEAPKTAEDRNPSKGDNESEESGKERPSRLDTGAVPPNTKKEQSQAELKRSAASPGLAPPDFLGSVGDENLKKLLMSWYYAGYYTGLYEGQQQQQQQQQARP